MDCVIVDHHFIHMAIILLSNYHILEYQSVLRLQPTALMTDSHVSWTPLTPQYATAGTQSSRSSKHLLGSRILQRRSLRKYFPFIPVLLIRRCPGLNDLRFSGLAPRNERHLKRIGLDDEERVGRVQGYVDLEPGHRIDLLPKIETPEKATAGYEKLVLRERLAQARALAVTKRRHALHCGIDCQRSPVGRPAGFEPAFWTEVFRVGIFGRIPEECPEKYMSAASFRVWGTGEVKCQ